MALLDLQGLETPGWARRRTRWRQHADPARLRFQAPEQPQPGALPLSVGARIPGRPHVVRPGIYPYARRMCSSMRYPDAARQPIVDDLFGHRVPDPYRWLEDPTSPESLRWQTAQDALWHEYGQASLAGHAPLKARIAELSAVGSSRHRRGAATARSSCAAILDRSTRFSTSRARTAPRPRCSTRSPWTPAARPRSTTGSPTTPAGTSPSSSPAPAPNEPSCTSSTSTPRTASTDRSTACRYSPVAWLADGDAFYYVRALPDLSAWRVYLHRVAEPAELDVLVFGNGRADTTSYGLGMSADGRWLVISATAGTSASERAVAGRPARLVRRGPGLPSGAGESPRTTVANVAPDGRLYLATTVDAPHGRLCVADPAKPAPEQLDRPGPRRDRRCARRLRRPRRFRLPRPLLVVATIRHAARACPSTTCTPASASARSGCRASGPSTSLTARPNSAHEPWFGYTDHVTPETVYVFDARTGDGHPLRQRPTESWRRRRGAPCCSTRPPTAPRSGWSSSRVADSVGPRPTILYGLRRIRRADDAVLLELRARLGRGGRRVRGRPAARRRRGRRATGTAPGCSTASRTCSTTSSPPPSS